MALLNEITHSPSISVNVSTCKALIGHIEEGKQVSFLQDKERNYLTLGRLWMINTELTQKSLIIFVNAYLP